MRKKLCLVPGMVLPVLFAVYAFSGWRLQGPADKMIQLFTLVPGALFLSLSGVNPFSAVLRRLRELSTGGFLALLCVAVLAFTMITALVPMEGIPRGGDEAAYLVQSRIYARGAVAAPEPPVEAPRDLFPFRHFIFREGEWFVMYTPLHSLLMVPFTAAGVSWMLGPLQSVISLLGAFLLMRRLAGEDTARVGAGIMALSPFFLFMGSSHMAHNSNLMFITWALYLLVISVQDRRPALQLLCGFLLGAALNTKPYPVMPWTLTITSILILKLRQKAFPVLLRIAAGALLPVLFFLLSNSRYTGDPFSPAYNLARGGSLMGFGENSAWAPEYGDHAHTPFRGLMNLAKQAGTASTIFLGWPFLSLVPALIPLFYRDLLRRIWPLYLSILMIAPFMFIHYAAAIDYGPRHYYTVFPSFALLAALGLKAANERWGDRVTALACWLFLGVTVLVYIPDGVKLRSGPWQAIERNPVDLAEACADVPAVVFMEASEHGYPNVMSGFLATDPFLDGDVVFCAHQTPLEDLEHINGVFQGRSAYLYFLKDGEGCLEPWTLELAASLSPERELRPAGAPVNLPGAGF